MGIASVFPVMLPAADAIDVEGGFLGTVNPSLHIAGAMIVNDIDTNPGAINAVRDADSVLQNFQEAAVGIVNADLLGVAPRTGHGLMDGVLVGSGAAIHVTFELIGVTIIKIRREMNLTAIAGA